MWPGVLAEPQQVWPWILSGRVCVRAGRRPAWLKHGSSLCVVAPVPEEMLGRRRKDVRASGPWSACSPPTVLVCPLLTPRPPGCLPPGPKGSSVEQA